MLRLFSTITLICSALIVFAQDDLMKELEGQIQEQPKPVIATFKGTRLINFHTAETLRKGSLDFRISHRFGDINSGSKNLWGIDGPATLRLALDYSLTDRLMIGVSRTSYKKIFEGSVKYKFLKQMTDGMPITVTGLFTTNYTTEDDPNKAVTGVDKYEYRSSRLAYVTQLMISRKFSPKLSFQVAPTLVHYNLVMKTNDKNDMVATVFSGRYKISHGAAITAEYAWRITDYSPDFKSYHNVAAIGFDIETGGHVFQVFVTNGAALNESVLIPYTTASIQNREIRIGFNISRVFEFRR